MFNGGGQLLGWGCLVVNLLRMRQCIPLKVTIHPYSCLFALQVLQHIQGALTLGLCLCPLHGVFAFNGWRNGYKGKIDLLLGRYISVFLGVFCRIFNIKIYFFITLWLFLPFADGSIEYNLYLLQSLNLVES